MFEAEFLTVREVARLLRVRESTIYTWAGTGALPSVRVGRLLRFQPDEIQTWIVERSSSTGDHDPVSPVTLR